MLETGIENSHIYTLDLHLRYIIKTLFIYDNQRLPHQLTKKLIQKRLFWFKDIDKLCRDCNTINIEECSTREDWELLRNQLLTNLKIKERAILLHRASSTTRIYNKLNYENKQLYFENIANLNMVSWIFKARCDLIELNATRFQQHRSHICSLCNLQAPETITHFLAICPMLRHIRFRCFGKVSLTEDEVINVLNNVNFCWSNLTHYIIDALAYRKELIAEFNY